MQFAKEEMSKRSDKEQLLTLFQDQEYDEYWHSRWDQVRRLQEWQEKKNDKKSDNEKKTAKDDISNIKFANMTNLKSFKYANVFINKTFNNSLWKNVIYDSDCNDSLIYDLNRFVNEITSTHELIDTFNDSMMIEKYEIMLVTNHINDKNRRMFFENIVYV
jgi:hypothetical protein